ncbi:MAG: hypothetical protein ABEJ67_03885 [Halanaeroarchaeum sp.]
MVALNETTIAMAFAVIGIVGSLVWFALGVSGLRILRDIRDGLS